MAINFKIGATNTVNTVNTVNTQTPNIPDEPKKQEINEIQKPVTNDNDSHLHQNTKQQPIQQSEASDEIIAKINELRDELTTAQPKLTCAIKHIFKATLADPAQVTLLTDEQRSVYFRALMKQTNIEIVTKSVKSRSKKTTVTSVEDLL